MEPQRGSHRVRPDRPRARRWRVSVTALAVVALVAGIVSWAPASAAGNPPPGGGIASAGSATSPQMARGVIIRTLGLGAALGARGMVDAMPVGIDVARTRALARSTDVLIFDELVTEDVARGIARALEARPDILWAEPDLRVQTAAASFPNDPLFPQMNDMWNGGGPSDFSIKAPLAWGVQKGSPSVVVAVIDTGITQHPDLDTNVVAGYDFISDAQVANDGNAWDPDPADMGDWITPAESSFGYFEGCDVSNSSWHGTHVSGTVAAVQDNNLGITGVAPGVKIQAVRALGKCGGYTSDIIASVTWASGGTVPGVPANGTPAQVINMSLGGEGVCGAAYSSAISGAIARGTTVVVAAGNENEPITNKVPANCPGVIAVTATDSRGQRAGYSNYGVAPGQATIAAPGGDYSVDPGILSTYNAGTTSPIFPDSPSQYVYDYLQGTSMATPHVAGAAALLYSAGVTTPESVRAALVSSVQPFGIRGNSWDCTTLTCGAGILDAGRLPLGPSATVPGAPTGVSAVATSTTSATISWTPPADDGGSAITGYVLEESVNGGAFAERGRPSATGTQVFAESLTPGATYQYRVAAINAQGIGSFSTASAPLTMPTDVTRPPGAPTSVQAVATGTTTARVTWSAPSDDGGSAITGYRVERSVDGSAYALLGTADPTPTSVTITNMTPGSTYIFRIAAINAQGVGAYSLLSAPLVMPTIFVTTPGPVSGFTKGRFIPTARTFKVTVRWKPPVDDGGAAVTGYIARLGRSGSWTSWTDLTSRAALLTSLRRGATYRLQVKAVNAEGPGALAVYRFTTPR